MTDTHTDPRTPGRRRTLTSTLAQADLVRRLQALNLPEADLPRVLRFVADEVERALSEQAQALFSADELLAAGASPKLVDGLREERSKAEQLAAIRAAGLHRLSEAELEAVLADAKSGGE